MFGVGDIVYCINVNKLHYEESIKHDFLNYNEPYVIDGVNNFYVRIKNSTQTYISSRFISEKEYRVSKRLEKLNKIKECLK